MAQDPADRSGDINFADLDVAIAHWHVRAWGGAEYLVTKLAKALDVESVYTLGAPEPDDPNPYGDVGFEDVTGVLDYPRIRRIQRLADRVFEYSQWEDVDWRKLGDPDVLVTSGATTRAVITPDDTLHVNYCHSPPRWFYDLYHDRKGGLTGALARPLLRHLRTRDASLDPRVDHYFVNSPIIKRRLWKYYKRDAEILYPPVDIESYRNDGDDGFYLHLGRLDHEKGIEAVVDAFRDSEHELVLAGGRGDAYSSVRDAIENADNIDYRGFVSEEEKYDLLARCQAVVFNGRSEDFGIVPIEANASGKPVLTRDEGFPGIYVEDGKNGFLHDGTPKGIQETIERFGSQHILNSSDGVERFDVGAFRDRCRGQIVKWYAAFTVGTTPDDYP